MRCKATGRFLAEEINLPAKGTTPATVLRIYLGGKYSVLKVEPIGFADGSDVGMKESITVYSKFFSFEQLERGTYHQIRREKLQKAFCCCWGVFERILKLGTYLGVKLEIPISKKLYTI